MASIRAARHGDLYVALLILVASLSVSGFAYTRISQQEAARSANFVTLREGEHFHIVRFGDTCIGNFKISLSEDRIYSLRGDGHVRGRYRGEDFITGFNFEYYFNPLGQLQEGVFKLNAMGVELTARNRNPNPIFIDAGWKLNDRGQSRSLKVPGPITISAAGEDERGALYRISHDLLTQINLQRTNIISESFLEQLMVSVRETDNLERDCPSGSEQALDITILAGSLSAIMSTYPGLSGPGTGLIP